MEIYHLNPITKCSFQKIKIKPKKRRLTERKKERKKKIKISGDLQGEMQSKS